MKYIVTAAYADVIDQPQVYETEVEADSPEEAERLARAQCIEDNGGSGEDGYELTDLSARPVDMRDLLVLHQMLYPDRYPQSVQPDHVYWSDEPEEFTRAQLEAMDSERLVDLMPELDDFDWPDSADDLTGAQRERLIVAILAEQAKNEHPEFEWDSGTIMWVADYLHMRLKGHPDARLED